jgi:2-isopropylmalate synthase
MTPESVGVPNNSIVLGKHSGRHALVARYEALGHTFSSEELGEIYARFTTLADKKKDIYDQDLLALIPQGAPVAIAA